MLPDTTLRRWSITYEPAAHRLTCTCGYHARPRDDVQADRLAEEHALAHRAVTS